MAAVIGVAVHDAADSNDRQARLPSDKRDQCEETDLPIQRRIEYGSTAGECQAGFPRRRQPGLIGPGAETPVAERLRQRFTGKSFALGIPYHVTD